MTLPRFASVLSRMITVLAVCGVMTFAAGATGVAGESATPIGTTSVATDVVPEFPGGIMFTVQIPFESSDEVNGSALYYRINSDDTLNLSTVPPTNIVVNNNSVEISLFVDLQTAFVPTGVSLTYFWELSTDGNVVLRTNEEATLWTDTRFEWDTHASDQVTIYTYDISDDFAQWMLEQSQATIDDLEQRYDLDEIEPVAIWIYPNARDFSGTRQVNTREAIAGLSFPGASVISAIISDGDQREYGRVIPHEISHQALYHATENPFAFPPLWLDEGLATHYQTGGADHYAGMVWRAQEQGTLFDITSLNASFPFQPAQATLAYASSWSVIDYIETTYGPEGITRLIEAFSIGLPVDDAIEQALGVSSSEMNADWHQWIDDQGNPEDVSWVRAPVASRIPDLIELTTAFC